MATFFTEAWVELVAEAAAELEPIDGLSTVIQFEVTGGDAGKEHAVASIEDGQLASFVLGKQRGAECGVIVDRKIAAEIFSGELNPRVAYMRGDIKLTGAYSTMLFGMNPMYQAAATRRFWQSVAASTTFTP